MQVVVVSNLYPNSQEPTRGIFTQQLVHQLIEHVDVRVIAPLPWRPWFLQRGPFSKYVSSRATVPRYEVIDHVEVWHPRYLVIPKTARFTYGIAFFFGIYRQLKRLHRQNPIDLINVHWVYPDAVGVMHAARLLKIPVVVHALGCDINEFAKYPWRREQISWVLRNANMNVYVSQALAEEARALGVKHDRNRVILNGVDQVKFRPGDKAQVRRKLGLPLDTKIVLFAGNFQFEKGLTYLIEAWPEVVKMAPEARLVIIGSGPEEQQIRDQIQLLGVFDTIQLLGRQPHDSVPEFLQAADILCLPSLREGCPNIVLEALSSGTAVVGLRVGAVPDLVDETRGFVVPPRDTHALAQALIEGVHRQWDETPWQWMSWKDNSLKVLETYREAVRLATWSHSSKNP